MKFNNNNTQDLLKRRIEAYKRLKEDPNAGSIVGDSTLTERVPWYKSRDGENIIRILPNLADGAMFPWEEIWRHFWNNGQYLCPKRMYGKDCPFDEEGNRLWEANPESKEASKLFPAHRALAWIIDRKEEGKGPQMFDMPFKKMAYQIVNISHIRATQQPVFVDDPENGWDILFTKGGKGIQTDYTGVRRDDMATALHENKALVQTWLEAVSERPIKNLLKLQTYEYLKEVLHGKGTFEDEADAQPIVSTASRRRMSNGSSDSTDLDKALPVGDGVSVSKLQEMSRDGLLSLIESRSLDVNPSEWPDTEELKSVVSLQLGLTA